MMISIADAKNRLPALIHQVEAGETVTISRRGKAVAVVVSMEAFERMKAPSVPRKSAWEVLQQVRAELAAADAFPDWTDEEIDSWRDRTVQEPRCDFNGPEYDWADTAALKPQGPVAEDEKPE